MPWFPDFVSAVELARIQTRAEGQADPVTQYLTALNNSDARAGRYLNELSVCHRRFARFRPRTLLFSPHIWPRCVRFEMSTRSGRRRTP